MNDFNQIMRELNNVYRMYYGLYNNFAKLPMNSFQNNNPKPLGPFNMYSNSNQSMENNSMIPGPFNMYNNFKLGGNYTDKIKSFLFKEI